jgi:hypothetical protein
LTKIAIGDDPDKPLSLDDRQVADLMGMEQVLCFPKTRVGPDRDRIRGHVPFDHHLPLLPHGAWIGWK